MESAQITNDEKLGPAELERELIRLLSGGTHWGLPGHTWTISGKGYEYNSALNRYPQISQDHIQNIAVIIESFYLEVCFEYFFALNDTYPYYGKCMCVFHEL